MSNAPSLTAAVDEPARPATLRLWRAFAPLDMGLRARALCNGRVETACKGDLFRPEGEIAVVLGGCLVLKAHSTPLCAGVAGAGALVDMGGGADGRWIADGELYRSSLTTFLNDAGEVGLRFLLAAEDRRRCGVEARMASALVDTAVARVARLLLEIEAACGGADVPLLQSDLADLLGLRRTSVNAACGALRRAGAIRTVRGRTVVTDRGRLSQECGVAFGP